MVSHLCFYQLTLIALVWLCIMLQWVWPSDSAAACPTTLAPPPPRPKRRRAPKPFAGFIKRPPCDACAHAIAPRPHAPSAPPPTHRHDARAPSCDRHLHAFLPQPRLCLSGLGGLGQSPRQWPSQWGSLAAAAVCRVSWLFSRDPRHALARQARLCRPHRARHRVPGRRLPTICQPQFVKFLPHLHDRLTATSGGIIAGAIMQHRDQDTQQPVSNVA